MDLGAEWAEGQAVGDVVGQGAGEEGAGTTSGKIGGKSSGKSSRKIGGKCRGKGAAERGRGDPRVQQRRRSDPASSLAVPPPAERGRRDPRLQQYLGSDPASSSSGPMPAPSSFTPMTATQLRNRRKRRTSAKMRELGQRAPQFDHEESLPSRGGRKTRQLMREICASIGDPVPPGFEQKPSGYQPSRAARRQVARWVATRTPQQVAFEDPDL